MTNLKTFIFLISISFTISYSDLFSQEMSALCFTFDDGNPEDILEYNYEEWNQMILDHLKEYQLQAVLYVCGGNLDNPEGKKIIESWDNSGHIIANHTYNHLYYNKEKTTYEVFKHDILHCDSLINGYGNYHKYFRAPYLKYGETAAKRDSLVEFLKRINYRNGYVTIDASDWFYNSRLIKFIKEHPGESIEPYKIVYIEHLLDRAKFYDELAFQLLGRKVKHSILLHHNLTSALFLGDLIEAFKNEGWQIINASDALSDGVYQKVPDILPAGESIIWGLAKESGTYNDILRYPAEDSIYEEGKLDEAGL